MGWIGVDLDHTLAKYRPGWAELCMIGDPIPKMVERVKKIMAMGYEVRIMTARVSRHPGMEGEASLQRKAIEKWCKKHLGVKLKVTCEKDYEMICLYDDRAVPVEPDTGRLLGPDFPLKERDQP